MRVGSASRLVARKPGPRGRPPHPSGSTARPPGWGWGQRQRALLEAEDAILTMTVLVPTMTIHTTMTSLEVEEATLVGEAMQPGGALPHEAAHAAIVIEGVAALRAGMLRGRLMAEGGGRTTRARCHRRVGNLRRNLRRNLDRPVRARRRRRRNRRALLVSARRRCSGRRRRRRLLVLSHRAVFVSGGGSGWCGAPWEMPCALLPPAPSAAPPVPACCCCCVCVCGGDDRGSTLCHCDTPFTVTSRAAAGGGPEGPPAAAAAAAAASAAATSAADCTVFERDVSVSDFAS
eukprot:scaffold61737_cov70-Phaeocystis_antarctica.AAC.3